MADDTNVSYLIVVFAVASEWVRFPYFGEWVGFEWRG